MTPALFFALVILVAAMPFLPAFRELRLLKDATPLTVSRRSRVDVRHFANGLRDFLRARLGWVIDDVRSSGTLAEGVCEGVGPYLVVPDGSTLERGHLEHRVTVATGSLEIRGPGWIPREVHCHADLHFTAAVEVRAVLAEGDLELVDESTVLRWVHAGKHLVVGPRSRLFGRASADEALFLRAPTAFERIHAPTIQIGAERTVEEGRAEPATRLDPEQLASGVDLHADRALVSGDARIPPDVLVDFDVVALGDMIVGKGARVMGNLKAHGSIVVEPGAWIEGSVVAVEGVEVRRGAYVHGPVLSEGTLRVRPDARLGDPDRPTTSRARRITLHERARVHGTVWASEAGEVVTA